jgi:hypothetical protein
MYFHDTCGGRCLCHEMIPIKYRSTDVWFVFPHFDVTGQVQAACSYAIARY